MNRSSGQVIFCDDVREEMHGKITLVGCYGPEMTFATPLPATLPRLGLAIRLYTYKREEPFRLAIKVYVPGQTDPILDLDQTIPPPPANSHLDGLEPNENRKTVVAMHAVTGPLTITSAGPIRLIATVGDEEFQAGAIMITAPQLNEAANTLKP